MGPDPQAIDDYIRENRSRYTDQAIREQLIAAGHDPGAVDEALQRAGAPAEALPAPKGWRVGRWTFLGLVVLGAIGAGVIWQNQLYSAGGLAAAIYAVIAAIALGLGIGISRLVDRGATTVAAALIAVLGAVAALLLFSGRSPILAAAVVVAAGGLAAGLLILRRSNPAGAGMLGAAMPIVLWLAVTGTCYAPLFGPPVVQPVNRPGSMELQIEPPLSFAGSGPANCVTYAGSGGFSINADNLGQLDGRLVGVSVFTAGDPNLPAPAATSGATPPAHRAMNVSISINSPSGSGYTSYGSLADRTFEMDVARDGISGSLSFDRLEVIGTEDPEFVPGSGDPISGTISWTCQ